MHQRLLLCSVFLSLFSILSCISVPVSPPAPKTPVTVPETPVKPNIPDQPISTPPSKLVIMKGVDVSIPQKDFDEMAKAGINILTTEWGIEVGIDKAKAFLDKAEKARLKVVMDGGFTYTAWGFTDSDWDNLPFGKKPVWQKDLVQNWVKALKGHPSIYAWDICNEYGENLPSGPAANQSDWPNTAMTLAQLKQARNDVLQIDPGKPILIRTYSWDLDQPPFDIRSTGLRRPFEAGLAEIVSLNLYSNYLDNGKLQWPTVIEDVTAESVRIIKSKDPNIKVWLSLAAFEDNQSFQRPTTASLSRDINQVLKISAIDGISYFSWGPTDIGKGKKWYLPETGADLWDVIKKSIKVIP